MGKSRRKPKAKDFTNKSESCSSSVVIIEEPAPDVISIASDTTTTQTSAAYQFRHNFHENWIRCTNTVDSRACAPTAFDAFWAAFVHRFHTTSGIDDAWRSLTRKQKMAFHVEAFVSRSMCDMSNAHKEMCDEEEIRQYFRFTQ